MMKTLQLLFAALILLSAPAFAQTPGDLRTPAEIEQYKYEVLKNSQRDKNPLAGNEIKYQSGRTDTAYCIPYSSCDFGDGFDTFTISSIQNLGSGCSANGYGDFTNMSTELQAGESYEISWSSNYGQNVASLWIDLNENFVFDEDERLISNFQLQNPGEIYTTQITIPLDAVEGETRLRIKAGWLQLSYDPCEEVGFGETEDYSVYIVNTPLANNVGVKAFNFPGLIESGPLSPELVVKNYGTETQSFPVNISIGDYSASAEVSNLQPGEEATVVFESWNAVAGNFQVVACTALEGDELPQNDCKETQIIVVNSINAYGFINYDPGGQFNNSWVAFDLAFPNQLYKMGTLPTWPPIIGAVYADGMIYGVGYSGEIYSFNTQNGQRTLLYEGTSFIGIAWDGENFYCNTYDGLYLLDISSGESTFIGAFENPDLTSMTSIAFDGDGNLYGVDLIDDMLFSIDKQTATPTTIGSLGRSFITILDISFDKSSNTLYMPGIEDPSGVSGLYVIDINTGEASLVEAFPNNLHFTGLAISSAGALIFPPKNLSASSSQFDVSLLWDEPFSNNYLSFNVFRDGEFIGSTDQTAYLDAGLEIGTYSYQVTAVYESGESEAAGPVEVSVGNPEISISPDSISEVLEMGEAVIRQITLKNTGNLDLQYELTPLLNNQTSAKNTMPLFNADAFGLAAAMRFGDDWGSLIPSEAPGYSPESLDSYCIPEANCNFGDGITDFKLAEIENLNSGCSPDGYGDFTDMEANLDAGMTYDISFASGYANNWVQVWLDLNQNEVFEESELLVSAFQLETAGQLYTTQITIPENAEFGETRLRVTGTWINPAFGPCELNTFGEAEDYTVSIGELASWIVPVPQSGSIAPGDSAVIDITINASGLTPNTYNGMIEISSNDSSNFIETIPVNLTVIEQGISNFFPVWDTPFNPMSVFVVGAQLDSLDLDLGDEIGIFDIDPSTGNEICVGAGLVINPVSTQNILEIVVSMNDGSNPDSANGFTPGNEIIYKIWNSLAGVVDDVTAVYPNPGLNETFTPLGTAIVELSGSALVPQTLTLTSGWNLISSRAQPYNTNMMSIFQPMIDMNVLEKVIDEDGGTIVYLPYPEPEGRWNNSIGNMEMAEGYYVKVSEDLTATMYGLPMSLPMDIPLEAGWNIMGYPAGNPQNALELVMPLIEADNLYKVIGQEGGVIQYLPYPEPAGTWINTIGNMENGQGYYIKVYDETSLFIDENPVEKSGKTLKGAASLTDYFEPVYQNNPFMPMHIILFANGNLEPGDEVGVFDGDICVGASAYEGAEDNMSITVTSMDDPDTELTDGYISGNNFNIKVWRSGVLYEDVEINHLLGPEVFTPLESYIGEITQTVTGIPSKSNFASSLDVYPNPAVDAANIDVLIHENSNAEINLYKLDGSLVSVIFSGAIDAGKHSFSLSLDGITRGVYLIRANFSKDGLMIKKLVVE